MNPSFRRGAREFTQLSGPCTFSVRKGEEMTLRKDFFFSFLGLLFRWLFYLPAASSPDGQVSNAEPVDALNLNVRQSRIPAWIRDLPLPVRTEQCDSRRIACQLDQASVCTEEGFSEVSGSLFASVVTGNFEASKGDDRP
jgi:hypothetical protein